MGTGCAGSTTVSSARSWVFAGPRTRSRLLPLLAGAAAGLVGGDARGQHSTAAVEVHRYTIGGAVTDSAQRPVFGAEVSLEADGRIIATVRSRRNGRFEFTDVPRIAMSVRVRRLGYHPYSDAVPIEPDASSAELSVVLQAAVIDIAPVIVEERIDQTTGRLREFYEHKRTSRFGLFLEREEIERRNASYISELLRSMRGVQVTAHGGTGNRVRLRGCRPVVWLNGLRLPDVEVDEVAHPADVKAIEVYVSMIGMPARFVDLVGKCGVVAIWTSDGQPR
jgi:hypothetical protein